VQPQVSNFVDEQTFDHVASVLGTIASGLNGAFIG